MAAAPAMTAGVTVTTLAQAERRAAGRAAAGGTADNRTVNGRVGGEQAAGILMLGLVRDVCETRRRR